MTPFLKTCIKVYSLRRRRARSTCAKFGNTGIDGITKIGQQRIFNQIIRAGVNIAVK